MPAHASRNPAFLVVMMLFLHGCGEKSFPVTANKLEESRPCIGCHDNDSNISPVTKARVVQEWLASTHNTKNGAGCADCHEPPASHPASCSQCHGVTPAGTVHIVLNPDNEGKCAKCHDATKGYRLSRFDGEDVNTGRRHFSNMSASFVSSRNVGRCRSCHNPHDTSSRMQQFREWSRSGKGDTTLKPWNNYDFKTRGTSSPGATPATSFGDDCVRCHTTTGYIGYVSSGFSDIHPWGSTTDPTKEVLGCNACHDDGTGNSYAYATRTVAPVTAYYNYSVSPAGQQIRQRASFPFPDVTRSNICLACHVGREIGGIIRAAAPQINFSSASFINSHYLTAGATVFAISGFHFYPDNALYANPANFLHDRIGVQNLNGTGSSGPCVTCHIGASGEYRRHTFMPTDKSGHLVSTACANCHAPGRVANARNMDDANLSQEKDGWEAALTVLAKLLKDRGYQYVERYPYFSAKNWQNPHNQGLSGGFGSALVPNAGDLPAGALTLGAAFNFNLIRHDYGAFAHNSLYTRRLLYDSIDWIQDGELGNGIDRISQLSADPNVYTKTDPRSGSSTPMKLDGAVIQKARTYLLGNGTGRP